MRVVNGLTHTEGRVQTLYGHGQWRDVCERVRWNTENGIFICQQLDAEADHDWLNFDHNSKDILQVHVLCAGIEEDLYDCADEKWNTTFCGNASISCRNGNVHVQ